MTPSRDPRGLLDLVLRRKPKPSGPDEISDEVSAAVRDAIPVRNVWTPKTIREVRAAKIQPGATLGVTLAPATGGLDAQPGKLVGLAVQAFTKNRTIQAGLLVLLVALGKGALVFKKAFDLALEEHRHFFEIAWRATFFSALDATYLFFAGAGLILFLKVWDNNPVNGPKIGKQKPESET